MASKAGVVINGKLLKPNVDITIRKRSWRFTSVVLRPGDEIQLQGCNVREWQLRIFQAYMMPAGRKK